jgi:hypothetical protein
MHSRRDLFKALAAVATAAGATNLLGEDQQKAGTYVAIASDQQRAAIDSLCPGEHVWVGGNRSGLSTAAAMSLSLVCGLNTHTSTQWARGKSNLRRDRVWCVSHDLFGVYRLLFEPMSIGGRLCNPLFHKSDVADWVWENKSSKILRTLQLSTGARVDFYSSPPKRSDDVGFVWFDGYLPLLDSYKQIISCLSGNGISLVTSWPYAVSPLSDIYHSPGVFKRHFTRHELDSHLQRLS